MKRLLMAIFVLVLGFQAFPMDLPMADVGKKRPAGEVEGIEQAPAAKEERIEQLQRASTLQDFPKEIQEKITSLLNTASGFGSEKFYNVAANLRKLRLVSKAERDKLDDPTFVNELITDLARRYTNGDKVKVVLILHTKSAADWLNKELFRVANNKLDEVKQLLTKVSEEIIRQLNQGHIDAALFLINSAKIPGKEAYLLNFSHFDTSSCDILILAASRAGNWTVFNKLLPQSLQYINYTNPEIDSTALFEAIAREHTQIALALIRAGAHPIIKESANELLDSALLRASHVNNTEIVRELLLNPVVQQNINFTNDEYTFTPIVYAASNNNYPMFQALLGVVGVRLDGDLLYEALSNNTQMVLDLFVKDIDVNQIADEPFERAAFGVFATSVNNIPLVADSVARERLQIISPKLEINQRGQGNETLLIRAVRQEKAKTVEMLLAANANVSLTDYPGHDALWYAQQLESHNKDHIIKMLQDASVQQEQARKKKGVQK